MADSQYTSSGDGYVEVGYEASSPHNGAMWYFYANTPHPGGPGGQQYVTVAAIPAGDFNHYAGFKMTRNRQGANNILISYWGASGTSYSTVVANNMGGGYGTPNAYAGDNIRIGSELSGNNGNPSYSFQSSNGNIWWINNQWQSNDGLYHYQTANGFFYRVDGPEFFASWSQPPS